MNIDMITTEKAALDALDKFVYAIEELKQACDGFNIFDAVGMWKQEVKHSAFFAWLLDPKAAHGRGDFFLHAFSDALFDYNKHISGVKPNREILSKFSCERLHAFASADDLVVKTEETLVGDDGRMDIYMRSDKSNITLVIENKTFTSTHDNQLNRYEELTAGNGDCIYVYLTPFGEKPTHKDGSYADKWCIFDYASILGILKAFLKGRRGVDAKLKFLIEDYINMVDDKLLKNNRNIMDKCKRIRREHGDALEILLNYSDCADKVIEHLNDKLSQVVPHFIPYSPRGKSIYFTVTDILDLYARCDCPTELDSGLHRFQMSVLCNDKITISMWLCKDGGEWSEADKKIHDVVAPQKPMGSKYCTLFSVTLLEESERYGNYDEQQIERKIEGPLGVFLKKLKELQNSL